MEDLREWILSSINRVRGIPRTPAIHHYCINSHPSRTVSTIWCPGCQNFFQEFPSLGFALTIHQGIVYFVHWSSTKPSSILVTVMISPRSTFLEEGGGITHYTYVYDYDIESRRGRRTSIAPYMFAITITNTTVWTPVITWHNPEGSDPFSQDALCYSDSDEEDQITAFVDDLL